MLSSEGIPEKSLYFIGSLKRKMDRVAAARYMITGDVATGGAAPEVGNMLMWSVPDWAPPLEA